MIGRDVDIPIPKFQTFSAFILPQSKHVLEFSALLVVQFEIAAFLQAHQLHPSLDPPCCKPQSCLYSFLLRLLNHFGLFCQTIQIQITSGVRLFAPVRGYVVRHVQILNGITAFLSINM